MGIYYTEVDTSTYAKGSFGGEDTGFIENIKASYRAEDAFGDDNSKAVALDKVWYPTKKKFLERVKMPDVEKTKLFGALDNFTVFNKPYVETVNNSIKYIKENPDLFPEEEFQNITLESLEEQAKEYTRQKLEDRDSIASRQTFSGGVGEFIGTAAGATSFTDALSLAVPTKKIPYLNTLINKMFQNVIINTGTEAVKYPEIKSWTEEVTGDQYTFDEFLQHERDVALGTVAFTGAFEGLAKTPKVYRFTKDKTLKGIELLQDAYAKKFGEKAEKNVDLEAIKARDEIDTYINSTNPINNDAGNLEHQNRLDQTVDAMSTKDLTKLPKDPPSDPKVPKDIYHYERDKDHIKFYDPNEIKVDAETFQFKAGGDIYGVTERLKDVKQWDPISANTVIVYEKADGDKFIVDGHQRLALAKKLLAENPDQKIDIIGFPLREIDNVSMEEAKIIAAFKNIREGTGTAIDAAKILKVSPDLLGTLPPRSALVQQAQGLIQLSDDAFRLINNDVIPANYGAIVGRNITDPADQIAVIEMLKRLDPSNNNQAEAIVRQMKETGFSKATQESLFGEEVISESLLLERAKILDTSMSVIKNDKQLFKSLIENADKIEESGNVLNKVNNQSNEAIYAKAIQIIKANANTKGPISESLTNLAKEFKEGGSKGLQGYAREFANRVRESIAKGEYDRITTSGDGIDIAVAKEADKVSEPAARELSLFDEGLGSKGEKEQAKSLDVIAKEEMQMAPEMADVPVYVEKIDPNTGGVIQTTQTVKQIMDELAQDERALNRLKGCI
jgi:ubiquinone biosynthesis protein COQ9